ncbi:MAG: polymerase protein [candidate division WS6 bacterium GW2011_GWF1_35_23]|uniref:DNA polymerase I n=1 Tax=candidate division WS6 bacterium GW2011_GWF1_35_23 TaxID=1619097 RepID=A0A0G0C8I3_9BACT|nr:MAG: polymerase protein [candidate division WS6 bacterium GW2011_GWF1_35_23]
MNLVKTSKDRFLAIDANAIVHRAFHAYPGNLQTDDGVQVNAVYGFTVMLLSALKTFDPKYVLCAFDTSKPTFRHEEYLDYKATRKPTDQSLIDQFPLVEEVLKAFNIPIIKKEGFEADDILGTISKMVDSGKWKDQNLELYILSGDRDLFQLVRGDVKVCLPSGNFSNLLEYDRENVFKTFGVYPEQVVDYKAIVGDVSDNIPGVKGVGDKTVIGLLGEYGDFDTIYKNLTKLKPRLQVLLGEGIEQAELSRKLAKIDQDMDVDIYLESCLMKDFDRKNVLDLFRKFKFKSLVARLDDIFGKDSSGYSPQLNIFNGSTGSVEWASEKELESLSKNAARVVCCFLSKEESTTDKPLILTRFVDNMGVKTDRAYENGSYTLRTDCETTFCNFENLVSHKGTTIEVDLSKSLDISLFSHVINSEKRDQSLKDLAFDYVGKVFREKISPLEIISVLDAVEEVKNAQISKANEIELYEYTLKSIKKYLQVKAEYLLNVLRKIEMPVALVLSKMEERGIKVEIEVLERLNDELFKKIGNIKEEIFASVGHEFNLNSPKQLSDVLYNELNLPSKNGFSTREDILVSLSGAHPCVEKLLEFRALSKVYGTYTSPMLAMAKDSADQSIHTDFKQTGTTSGRFSSINPNMQNLPAQGEWSEKLRTAFVARKGFKLVGMDYSQIELRIMADMSMDNLLIKDFNDGLDIHSATASRILGKEIEDITKKERSIGKTVNFAILFGQTPFGLSSLLKIDSSVALEYIQNYFEHYLGVEEYIRSLEKEAYRKGYVQTMFGTTRMIGGIRSKNIRMNKAAKREAVNMPIQGSEADIMKLGMVKLDELIAKEFNEEAHILLQVHDELVFEVVEGRVDEFEKKALDILKNIVSLEVPLDVHVSHGDNLAELK